jgi:hypothetical protein
MLITLFNWSGLIEKKNAGTNDSDVFICKIEKNTETIVLVFLCV